jgi:hypothetical protein
MVKDVEHCSSERAMVTDGEDLAQPAFVVWPTEHVHK